MPARTWWGYGACPGGGHPSWGMLQARQSSLPCWEMLPSPTLAWWCLLPWISFFLKGCHPFLWEGIQNYFLFLPDIPDLYWKIIEGSLSGHVIPNNSCSIPLRPRSPIWFRLFDRIWVNHSSRYVFDESQRLPQNPWVTFSSCVNTAKLDG